MASPVILHTYPEAPLTAVVEYVSLVLEQAMVLPVIGEGVLKDPRIQLHFVPVFPQPLDANTHTLQPELFPGMGPKVIFTLLLAVVCGLAKPLIKQPADADQV